MSDNIVACPGCARRNRVPASSTGVPRCAECHAPLPWLVDADDATFAAASDTRLPVLVDLWAPWCGPCRVVGPAVEEATRRFAGRMKTVKVNVDEAPAVASRFAVQGVPTLLVLHRGREAARQVGALPATALERWVEGFLTVPAA
jgi:thioredoxin 2